MTNNAANTIDAKSKSLRDLLKERRYKVGYFQREYKWERDNIEDLIVDLERSFFANYDVSHTQESVANYDRYYMGPIVLFQDEAEFSIVDGQQRLTSFTLLMIFLNNLQKEVLNITGKLDGYIFSEFYGKQSYNLNIEERIPVLDRLFREHAVGEQLLLNESSRNLFERYLDIEDLFPLRLKKKEVLPLFINWLTEKLVFIEIMTQTSESAYTIFETMNDRGLNLTPTEMLKSFLLSKAKDDEKIKELDILWKTKIGKIKEYGHEEDLDFFRSWFRGKHAITIRTSEKGSLNEDFEKIGTRFHNWVQEKHETLLKLASPSDFYYFIQSDFQFFSEVYEQILEWERTSDHAEHKLKLQTYKGISQSLSYPLLLAPIQKTDDELTIENKLNLIVDYLDCVAMYRLLLSDPITHSSIRNAFYSKIKEVRNIEFTDLNEKFKREIDDYKKRFGKETDYILYNPYFGKYLLARLLKINRPEIPFETIYFQRRKDCFVLFQIIGNSDVDSEVNKIPRAVKDIIINSLASYCMVPREFYTELEKMSVLKRLRFLISKRLLFEIQDPKNIQLDNLKDFFIQRNKMLKNAITTHWNITMT